MNFLSIAHKKYKYCNIRKRVYDVMNIYIAIGFIKKVKTTFYVNENTMIKPLLARKNDQNDDKKFMSAKQDIFLSKIEELVF